MILFVHGAAGGWDELLIALVAVAVLWIAVKLAGRKPADDDETEPLVAKEAAIEADGEDQDPAPAPVTKLG